MTTIEQAPADRLADLYATLRLSPAGMVELFNALELARSKVRKTVAGEDPQATQLAGIHQGMDLLELVQERVDSSRRGQVIPVFKAWLDVALAVSSKEYELILGPAKRRAQAAKDEQVAHRQTRTRA